MECESMDSAFSGNALSDVSKMQEAVAAVDPRPQEQALPDIDFLTCELSGAGRQQLNAIYRAAQDAQG